MAELIATVHRYRQALFAVAMITVVAWLLWSARGALPAFFIGLALVFVLDPAVTLLHRREMPRWAGVIVMYIALVAVIYGLVAYVLPPISRQAREFMQQLPELGSALVEVEQGVGRWYERLPLPAEIRTMVDGQLMTTGETLGNLLRGLVAPTLNAIVGAATFLLGLVVVPVWLFFVLKDREASVAASPARCRRRGGPTRRTSWRSWAVSAVAGSAASCCSVSRCSSPRSSASPR